MRKRFAVAITIFALACSLSAMAVEGTTKIVLHSAVELDGKQIAPGEYKVKWTGSNDDLQVTFTRDKTDVMTTRAKLVEGSSASRSTAVVTDERAIKEIRPENTKVAIVFAH